MSRTLRFYIGNVEIRATLSWVFISMVLLGISVYLTVPAHFDRLSTQMLFLAATFSGLAASLILHEVGHLKTAKRNNVRLDAVSPQLVGTLPDTVFEAYDPATEVRVGIAGPLMSLLLAATSGAAWWLLHDIAGPVVTTTLGLMALVNLGIAVVSLMPGYPFDGGRILRGVFWYLNDDLMTSTKIVGYVGYIVIMAGMTLGALLLVSGGTLAVWGVWVLLTAFTINRSVGAGISHVFWSENSRRLRVDDLFVGGTRRIQHDVTIDDAIERMLEGHDDGPLMVFKDGEAVGLVHLASIRPVPRRLWTERVVGDVMEPISGLGATPSSSSLSELVDLLPPDQDAIALITRDGVTIGATDREDVVRRLQQYLAAERMEKMRRGGR